jgi:hypothetical protein
MAGGGLAGKMPVLLARNDGDADFTESSPAPAPTYLHRLPIRTLAPFIL